MIPSIAFQRKNTKNNVLFYLKWILYYDAQEAAMYLKENILENYMF